MQNLMSQPDGFDGPNHTQCDKQFTKNVIDYQKRVVAIIDWLLARESELKQRIQLGPPHDAVFSYLLEEYGRHEKFITEIGEFCHTIMECKEDGQEMRENFEHLTDEDRDEVGIQMDTMEVYYEKLKILAIDRLQYLQKIIDERQQTKIEQFEEWLSVIEMKIASSNNIGPDYSAIQRQIKDTGDLMKELQHKQNFLDFMSTVIIFDEVDPESLEIRNKSCETLDERLSNMNRRWTEICRFVEDRTAKLNKAESIWRLLNSEGPQLTSWLNKVEASLNELSGAARNMSDVQPDKVFIAKLLSRSDKIDAEIKSKQSFYTSLESRVRTEVEKLDDPCSMLVIELERKLEDIQDSWNSIMNRKRMLDYTLQALSNPVPKASANCNMIPLPDPITATSNHDLRFNDSLFVDEYPPQNINHTHETSNGHTNKSSSPDNHDKNSSPPPIDEYLPDTKAFDTSISSDTKSLVYGNSCIEHKSLYTNDNESQDELSTTSMTASYPLNMTFLPNDSDIFSGHRQKDNEDLELHLAEQFSRMQNSFTTCDKEDGVHSCRVEEWKHSLESFSTWLKRVETSLGVDSTLENIVNPTTNIHVKSWACLDMKNRLLLLNEIENQIHSTCQSEFDCLILQGQQIIEDLIPEIGENEYEANLKEILEDMAFRYGIVRRCLTERKQEIADKEPWYILLNTLRDSCDQLIEQMGEVLPETNIGVDLITIAQQQDQLIHAKTDLENNIAIQSCIKEAKLFLEFCDTLQRKQINQSHSSLPLESMGQSNVDVTTVMSNHDIWMSFKTLKEDVETQLDRLTLHYSELSQLIEDRLSRLDQVHKEMHALQHRMQELATRLQVAEILKSSWVLIDNLSTEKLSEQLEDLKLYRERLAEIETVQKSMNSIFDWMTQLEVPLSHQNLNRISELNAVWNSIQASVDERQKLIEQAFDNQGASEQKFLNQTLAGYPHWERRVATSRVPYFIDNKSNKTLWDHPKFSDLLKTMDCVKPIVFAAYRTALKLRIVQKKFGIDLLMLEQLKEIFEANDLGSTSQSQVNGSVNQPSRPVNANDSLIGVEQIIYLLKAVYERIQNEEKPSLDVPLSIDLTLNWLLNLYDS